MRGDAGGVGRCTPAAAASRITTRPLPALALSAAIAVASVWIGLTASYTISTLPPSFAILTVATCTYLATIAASRLVPAGRTCNQPAANRCDKALPGRRR